MSWFLSRLTPRLFQAAGVVLLAGILSFLMMSALPGDAAFRVAAARFGYDNLTSEAAATVRAELAANPAGLAAFGDWMLGIVQFDLGLSLVSGEPVWHELSHQLGATLELSSVALLLTLLIGLPLGVFAGLRAGGWLDRLLLPLTALFRALPQFLLGLILIVVLAVQLRWLPAAGYGEPRHLFLPALTLALGLSAAVARVSRDAMVRVVNEPYYDYARWKGLSAWQVWSRHGLRNIAVPVLTYLGLQFIALIEGVVVVESIFGWPGIGHAMVHAVFHRDVPIVQGTVLVLGLSFVLINLLLDTLLGWIDPRWHHE